MRKLSLSLIIFMIILVACQPAEQDLGELPTQVVLPSATNTITPSDTPAPTNTPTITTTPTITPSPTVSPTRTVQPSRTPSPRPSQTLDSTRVAIGTATAQVEEAPQFSTITPVPPGILGAVRPTSTGAPEVVADVVITERQFQEEIDRLIAENENLNRAEINFVPGAVQIELTALSDGAFATGTFDVIFRLTSNSINNFVQIQTAGTFDMQGGLEPSEEFIQIASSDGTILVFDAFNFILNQRLGEGNHDLEFIEIGDDTMGISLFVPEPSSS